MCVARGCGFTIPLLCLMLFWGFTTSASAAIYWNSGTSIGRANLDGSVPEPKFISLPFSAGVYGCGGVAVDDRYIYWSDVSQRAIGRANLDGTEPDFAFIPNLDDSALDTRGPCGLDIEGSYLYWANSSDHSIGRANVDGTEVDPEYIVTTSDWTDSVEAEGAVLYWVAVNAWLSRARLDGSERVEPLIDRDSGRGGLAITESHIYWPDVESSISRANLDGSGLDEAFITGLERPCDVAVSGSSIYWVESQFVAPTAIGRANLDGSGVEANLVPGADGCGIALDGLQVLPRPPAPPPQPSRFRIGRLQRNERDGSVTFPLRLFGDGTIAASAGGTSMRVLPEGIEGDGTGGILTAGRKRLRIAPTTKRGDASRCVLRVFRSGGTVKLKLRVLVTEPDKVPVWKSRRFLLFKPSAHAADLQPKQKRRPVRCFARPSHEALVAGRGTLD